MAYRPAFFIAIAVVVAIALVSALVLTGRKSVPADAPHFVTEGGMVWYTEELSARNVARQENKILLFDFTADWCGACKEMDELVFQHPDVQKVLKEKFITVRLDVTESTPTNDALLDKYGVSGLPAVVFARPRGHALKSPRILGLVPVPHFLATLNQL